MADIEKALQTKRRTDPRTKSPKEYMKWLPAFDRQEADKLPPHRQGTDQRDRARSERRQAFTNPVRPII
jgi:hypothetical protein